MHSKIVCCLLFATALGASCERFDDPSPDYSYKEPEAVPGGLSVSTLQNADIDEAMITAMTNRIIRDEYERIDAVLILRNNQLVYEEYFHGYYRLNSRVSATAGYSFNYFRYDKPRSVDIQWSGFTLGVTARL